MTMALGGRKKARPMWLSLISDLSPLSPIIILMTHSPY